MAQSCRIPRTLQAPVASPGNHLCCEQRLQVRTSYDPSSGLIILLAWLSGLGETLTFTSSQSLYHGCPRSPTKGSRAGDKHKAGTPDTETSAVLRARGVSGRMALAGPALPRRPGAVFQDSLPLHSALVLKETLTSYPVPLAPSGEQHLNNNTRESTMGQA